MKKVIMTTLKATPLACLLAIVLTSGCVQQPVAIATEDPVQLTRVATEVVTKAAYLNSIFNQCAPLGGDAEFESISVQQDWLEKNWATVAAADGYYSERLRAETVNYNNTDIALAAVLLSHNAQRRAISELNLKQRTPANQQKTCVRRLQAIAQDEMNFTQDPQVAMDLQTLQNKYTGDSNVITPIPTLAANVRVDMENGRSYFVLAEEFRKECPDARFIVLFNQWPQEAYGAYCGEVPISLITCEWGKCKQSQ